MVAARLRRWWPAGVVLAIVACLGMPAWPPHAPGVSPTASSASSTIASSSALSPTPASTPAAPLVSPPAADLRELQQDVAGLRGLAPTSPVNESFLSPEDFRQHLLNDFFGDDTPDQAADEALLLSLLDLVEPGTDLQALYRDLYGEQVAGYYDPQAGRMYLRAGPAWTGVERGTYVHEFTRALQDQIFNLHVGLGLTDEACRQNGDRCRALTALAEGDASLVEEQWLRTFATSRDLVDLREFAATSRPTLEAAPEAIQRDFLFPYEEGLEYVRALYLRNGWAAVDRAYESPPQTTEEILHPGQPARPSSPVDLGDLASALGEGWQTVDRGVLGEWRTRLMLQSRLDAAEAEAAAAGWGGDEYVALSHLGLGEKALVLVDVWDRPRDAHEFAMAMLHHAEARFGPATGVPDGAMWTWQDGRIRLIRSYLQTLWILAPSSSDAEALLQAVPFPVPT